MAVLAAERRFSVPIKFAEYTDLFEVIGAYERLPAAEYRWANFADECPKRVVVFDVPTLGKLS
jgi:hypothetical protein